MNESLTVKLMHVNKRSVSIQLWYTCLSDLVIETCGVLLNPTPWPILLELSLERVKSRYLLRKGWCWSECQLHTGKKRLWYKGSKAADYAKWPPRANCHRQPNGCCKYFFLVQSKLIIATVIARELQACSEFVGICLCLSLVISFSPRRVPLD